MTSNRNLRFVGIVEEEHVDLPPFYEYCDLDMKSRGMGGYSNIQDLGNSIAHEFGVLFKEKITYALPKGTDKVKTYRESFTRNYHPLSPLEQNSFEQAVLSALGGK